MNYLKLMVPVMMLVIAGCAGKDGTSSDDGGYAGADGAGGANDGATSYAGGDGSDGSATSIGDDRDAVVMNERVVYFAYDSADLEDASLEVIKQHGRYLADNPGEKVRLEGHTDERGSREYNIGLGERRAVSVQSALLVQGASIDQLLTVSYGEERPAALGSDESTYSQNRRVEIVYER
jgi:peptidoglycan-associated lipoprotein